jgi:hypothetical protein
VIRTELTVSSRKAILALAIAISILLPTVAAAAVQDPERNSTAVTGWHWWHGRSEDQLNALRKKYGERIIDIEVESQSPLRFTAVLVRNKGAYKRSWSWWFGFDAAGVKTKIDDLNGRIVDLEPYTVNGQRRFAILLVHNSGEAKKGWWWNYDLTPTQVTDGINQHKIRLIDLDTYLVNGHRRYSYVGIKNKGVDQKAWWWYRNVSPAFVEARLKEHKARLIDVERPAPGKLTVVMQRNDGKYWWWAYGLSQGRLTELFSTHGVRIADLESYVSKGKRRYAFVGIDNANAETRRLRGLIEKAFDDEDDFGDKVIRGVYVKQIGGPVIADLAAHLRFQPLSTLKLLPYLVAIDRIDRGLDSLNSLLTWTEATQDDPATDSDDRYYASCLTPGSPGTQAGRAQFRDALPTMMWESHGRTLDAFLSRYGPNSITDRGHQLGLKQTEMHFGCPQGNVKAPWAANRSTLADLGKMFEGVDQGTLLNQSPGTRQLFFDDMINLDYNGISYASPITHHTTGPINVKGLRPIVKREAGPSKQGIVEDFLKGVHERGKGGSGGPSGNEIGYSDFLHVTLPFYSGRVKVSKTFVAGWFIYKLKTPSGCPEKKAGDGGKCQAIWKPEIDAREKFRLEMLAEPIRLALKTWPTSP